MLTRTIPAKQGKMLNSIYAITMLNDAEVESARLKVSGPDISFSVDYSGANLRITLDDFAVVSAGFRLINDNGGSAYQIVGSASSSQFLTNRVDFVVGLEGTTLDVNALAFTATTADAGVQNCLIIFEIVALDPTELNAFFTENN